MIRHNTSNDTSPMMIIEKKDSDRTRTDIYSTHNQLFFFILTTFVCEVLSISVISNCKLGMRRYWSYKIQLLGNVIFDI